MTDKETSETIDLELRSEALSTVSSSNVVRKIDVSANVPEPAGTGLTGVAAKLAAADLPKLERHDRARLQMQSPGRLFFYWSFRNNPFLIAERAVWGGAAGYQLIVKLVNLTKETEEMHPAEASGSRWYDVDANCEYRAEVGLYATNRPYIRILFSNTVTTPRRRPSHRVATDNDWTVSAETFSRVLSASGFRQDAFEVALAGERPEAARAVIQDAFTDLVGAAELNGASDHNELLSSLLHLSLGSPLETLKWRIDASLFRILQQHHETLNAERARILLQERFGVDSEQLIEEEMSPEIAGASRVHFPRVLRKKLRRFQPLSSFDLPLR